MYIKMPTKVFLSTFNKKPIFEIWRVDEKGEKIDKYPVISFGLTKAESIIEHMEEILEWVNTQ